MKRDLEDINEITQLAGAAARRVLELHEDIGAILIVYEPSGVENHRPDTVMSFTATNTDHMIEVLDRTLRLLGYTAVKITDREN